MPTPGQEIGTLDFASFIGSPLVAMVNAQKQSALATVNFIHEVGFEIDPTNSSVRKPIYLQFSHPKETAPYQPALDKVAAITVTAGGSGYTSAPAVAISGGGGSGASAVAVLGTGADADKVIAVTITNGGAGYTSAPSLSWTGGGGSGAAASVSNTFGPGVPAQYETMTYQAPLIGFMPVPCFFIERAEIDFNCKINNIEYMDTATSFRIAGDLALQSGTRRSSAKLNVSASYQSTSTSGTKTERTYTMAVKVVAGQAEMPPAMERMLTIFEEASRSVPKALAPSV